MMDWNRVLNITLNVPSAADADWDLQGMVGDPDYDDHQHMILFNQLLRTKQKVYLGFAGV